MLDELDGVNDPLIVWPEFPGTEKYLTEGILPHVGEMVMVLWFESFPDTEISQQRNSKGIMGNS